MNTKKKSRRPRGDGMELMTLKRLWCRMSQPMRNAWFELFAMNVEPLVFRCLIYRELGVPLRTDEQLARFLIWVLEFDDAMQLRNN